ncbi:ubiquitin-conjugating enzyme [Ascodesmis nigricans]|uniref:E2 ubiquitin-conjugating enzyme n=1 Tax=Ascodesmis nigricans TaxID=341454 RepID=A0A4S2N0C8_9PEZI|nr:ubiquitin-conjugating enzyme [Ascodesmis nigricans]
MSSSKRITKEYGELENDPIPGVTIKPIDQDMYNWDIEMSGPAGTPYANGTFKVRLTLPTEYPFKPPTIAFKTKIYHPNVSNDDKGNMCLGMLRTDDWKPSCKLRTVLTLAMKLLNEPDTNDAVETSIVEQMKSNHDAYVQRAKEWTKTYAV